MVSNQKFWNVPFISLLKIRGSWGKVGNANIGGRRFLYTGTVAKNTNTYRFGITQQTFTGFDEGQLGNPDVTWETAIKRDIGLNIQFLHDKVSLQADIFNELRKNILLRETSIPKLSGYFPWVIPYANIGRVRDKGLDARLKIQNTTPGGFHYKFVTNFTYAHNTVLANAQPPQKYAYQNQVGHELGWRVGLKALGFSIINKKSRRAQNKNLALFYIPEKSSTKM